MHSRKDNEKENEKDILGNEISLEKWRVNGVHGVEKGNIDITSYETTTKTDLHY
jgi:hypothetical protein